MAIYHLSAGFVSRSTGRSAVQSAAYISGTVLGETRREMTADYRNRSADIAFRATLAPEYAPNFAKNLSVWDALETFEDRYAMLRYKTEETQEWYKNHAQVAQTIVVALPRELTFDAWKGLVTEFAMERFVSRGLVVSLAIHNDEGNPHSHFQVSRRSINAAGEWSWAKDRDITTKTALIETRKLWAEKTNLYLEKEGIIERVDHRSFLDMGLPFEPTRHEGWFAHKLQNMGVASRIIEENKDIKGRNKERVAFEPEAILKELCTKRATFSAMDLARIIQARMGDDAKLAGIVYEASLEKAILVGSSLDGQARYSSPDYVAKENQAIQLVKELSQHNASIGIDSTLRERVLNAEYAVLNREQRHAVETLTADAQLGVLIGRAGTGKTTTLKAVVDLYHQSDRKVIGLTLSAAAAETLKMEANCEGETIAFYLDKWERLEAVQERYWSLHPSHEHAGLVTQLSKLMDYGLTKEHLIIVDEAGMVGTSQWHRLLHQVQKAGAKLLAVGDDHQFKAIDAGDFFRKFIEVAKVDDNVCTLKDIMRQKEPWMKEASLLFSELKTYEALACYEHHGLIQKIAFGDPGIHFVAKSYTDRLLSNAQQTGLLLANTNMEYDALNGQVRHLLRERGMLEARDFSFNHRAFSVKDKIIFLENDREKRVRTYDLNTHQEKTFFVKNGTQGRILSIQALNNKSGDSYETAYQVMVAIDKNTYAKFNTNEYSSVNHAYAMTLVKAQGKTADWCYVLASKFMDANATYMALTRHRHEAKLFYDEKSFVDFKALQCGLSRVSAKDLVIDYTINPEHENAWENVQEYKLLGQDLSATIQEKNWESYQALKLERIELGKIILNEWKAHQDFMRQAGITQESLAIACGLKVRALSLAEIEAKFNVSVYAEKALQARLIWQEVRQTHPGKNCYQHERYGEFTTLRQERNALATLIISNKPLYKEFVTELGATRGIGWKTLASQAKQGIEFKVEDRKPSIRNIVERGSDSYLGGSAMYTKRFERLEPQQVKDELQQKIGLLAHTLLGDPQQKNAREWRYGNNGSISVCVAGAKQGLYGNFEAGSYGGPLKLIQDRLNVDHKEAYQWAINWLGYSRALSRRIPVIEFKPETPSKQNLWERQWSPIYPVPADKQNPDLNRERNLSYQLTQHGRVEVERYPYKDANGSLLGYAVRLENNQGKKVVLPLTYCQDEKGVQQWRWQGFGNKLPLYGLDRLSKFPDKSVLVVEGEKTANHAQSLFPEKVVISWPGGTGAVLQVDWSPIIGKNITLWPDNDKAGHQAMEQIRSHLVKLNQEKGSEPEIQKVILPSEITDKWDLADPLPKGWNLSKLQSLLPENSKVIQSKPFTIAKEKIAEILSSAGMSRLYKQSPERVVGMANELYEDSLKLHQLLKIDLTDRDKGWIEEKSIVASALHSRIQERFFKNEPYWSGVTKSTSIALIAAEIKIKDPYSISNNTQLIVRAHRMFCEEKEKFEQHFLLKFKDMAEEGVIKLLSQEQLSCYHQTNKMFNNQQCDEILKSIKEIQESKMSAIETGTTDSHQLGLSAIVHETLKSYRQMEVPSIQKALKETTLKMLEQQKSGLEGAKESSKAKEIQPEKDTEISL